MKNLAELKKIVMEKAHVDNPSAFMELSPRHAKFWKMLNDLGQKTFEDFCPHCGKHHNGTTNTDEATELNPREWDDFIIHFSILS